MPYYLPCKLTQPDTHVLIIIAMGSRCSVEGVALTTHIVCVIHLLKNIHTAAPASSTLERESSAVNLNAHFLYTVEET